MPEDHHAENQGIDAHIAVGRKKHDEPLTIVKGRPRKDLTLKQAMARKLATKRGAAAMHAARSSSNLPSVKSKRPEAFDASCSADSKRFAGSGL